MFGGQLGTGRRLEAYVHVIESPTSTQLFYGKTHGRLLTDALRVGGIKFWHRIASDRDSLALALGKDMIRAIRHHDALPVLHLSAPLSRNGIELTDGAFLSLEALSTHLTPLNVALGDGLVVCMPDCHGQAAARLANAQEEQPPYYAVVGSHEQVAPRDSALAFAAFYHRLLNGASIDDAMEALEATSGSGSFYVQYSGDVRTVFRAPPPENHTPGPPGAAPPGPPTGSSL